MIHVGHTRHVAQSDGSVWTLGALTSFSEDPASYTDVMVADQRLTMVHQRPMNQDVMTFWAQSTPTDSNNSLGTPDGATSWSTGPEIQLSSFNAIGSTGYDILAVSVVVAAFLAVQLLGDVNKKFNNIFSHKTFHIVSTGCAAPPIFCDAILAWVKRWTRGQQNAEISDGKAGRSKMREV